MDRAEATGFGVATAGHLALLAALTFGLATAGSPPALPPAMEVSFAEDVGLVSASPDPAIAPPAQSVAPDLGAPEEAAPAPAAEPDPAPPAPAPPDPAPAPEPRPQPKQAAPAPAQPKAAPQPARERPAPQPKASPRPAREPQPKAGAGEAQRPRGSRLGDDILKGIGRDPSPSRETRAPGAVMSQQAMADIGSAIARQVQPCADRQVNPGPGANRIATQINLRLNRDGSLARRPTVVRQTGLDDENRRYAERVADLAIASFVGCAPLRGLPAELYDVPNGWSNFTLNYRLPG